MIPIESLVAIAREAGRAIQTRVAASRPAAEWKRDGSPITACDRVSHSIIDAGLRSIDPSTPIVSEGAALPPASERAEWPRWWIVDPLDGTKEFVAGLPDYTVNIALIENGVPTIGVVDAPAQGQTYWASRGQGAWRREGDAAPVRIYARPPAAGAPLRVIESLTHRSLETDVFARRWPVAERVAIGSSLKFCRIAEGRADVYPRFSGIMEWDVAAGDCIFRESGLHGQLYSPLEYRNADLRVPPFVIGFTPPPAAVVWFTGLPGAGKTTIARAVQERLTRLGSETELLDGDEIRSVFPQTGFSSDARDGHIRRVGHLASRLEAHGVTSLVSLVSPYRASRDFVRGLCHRFVEIHVATPAAECERRDPKGLYQRARAGQVAKLTGLDDPYESPDRPALALDTTSMTVDQATNSVMDLLLPGPDGTLRIL